MNDVRLRNLYLVYAEKRTENVLKASKERIFLGAPDR